MRICEKRNRLEAVVECVREPTVTFFLGDREDEESLSLADETPPASCQIQTHVEVHSPVEEASMDREDDEETLDTEPKAVRVDQTSPDRVKRSGAANTGNLNREPEKRVTSVVLDVKDSETEDLIQEANGYMKTSSRNILDLQMNGCTEEKENISPRDNEDLQYMTSVRLNSSVSGGDLTESRSFNIFDSSRVSEAAVGKRVDLRLDASEETLEVEVH